MKTLLRSLFHCPKTILLTFAFLLFLSCISIAQTVRYVATNGSDLSGDGTNGKPYQTILKAIGASSTLTGDIISVAVGTYTSGTAVGKSVSIVGAGVNPSDVILNSAATPYSTAAGIGFSVSANNVTIRNIKIINFNVGISNTVAVSNLVLDKVELVKNYAAGFYSSFSIDGLTITNSNLSYNGNTGVADTSTKKRGIYLLDGPTYASIKFDNNIVEFNGIAGIEISSVAATTSIDGITITNNKVRYNSEVQISAWLGASNPVKKAILIDNNTVVLYDTARYGIEIRNPAGSGKGSGIGSVVVSNNSISVVSATGASFIGNGRDMAAIAVIRRKEGASTATVNDQPQGVVVSGNTISDFQNPKAGEAYGIVFGGLGHKAFGNNIFNTEFPLQLQKGNLNFGSNASTTDIPGQANNLYFDRDNSKDVCVEIGSNTITNSGAPRLTTGTATTSLTLRTNTVTNTSIGETFCTLQQAIDFKATVAGNTITASPGTYDEQVIISKGVILDGIDSSNRIATFTGAPPVGVRSLFTVTAQNVTIKNFKFIVDLSKVYSAIVTSGDASNLLITGNTIISSKSAALFGTYSYQNAINISLQKPSLAPATDYGNPVGTISNITIQSNTIDALNAKFRAGIAADYSSGLIVGGNNVADGNNILANINHDVIIRNYFGDHLVKNNLFKGGGVEVSASKSNGKFTVKNNTFDGTYSHTINTAMVRVFTNPYPTRTINFTNNQFINQKWSISFENTRNVVLDSNNITATYDNFRLISVNTKLRQTGKPDTLETIDIKLTRNNLNSTPGLLTGTALEFLNFDQRPANNYIKGNYVIGDSLFENNFNDNIPTFIKVSNLTGLNTTGIDSVFMKLYPEYQGVQFSSTTGYWARDIFARYNKYYVNKKLKLATSFSTDDYNQVYDKIFDRQDDVNVGAVVMMPTWSGATSKDWADSTNWSYNFIPAKGMDAVIYRQANNPELYADAACDSIILSTGMSINTGNHSLTIYGNIRSNGVMNATIGSITLASDSIQILTGNMVVKNLTLNNARGAIISAGINNKVNILGKYTPTLGILTTNDNLVLKSTDSGTASIATFAGTGDYIIGKVSVERFIPARRSWRFLTAPVNATDLLTIHDAWQEGVNNSSLVYTENRNPHPGYGTHITLGTSTALGFDMGINNNTSIKGFNPVTVKWDPLPGTNIPINTYPAYMLFVRGDRSNVLSQGAGAIATNTTLETLGNVKMGDQNFNVAAKGFTLMVNPYPSPIDLDKIGKSNSTNVQDNFYVWDPKITELNGVGGYVTLSYNGIGTYDRAPKSIDSNSICQYIQSGSAFFAISSDSSRPGTLRIKESDKTIRGSDKVYRPQDAFSVGKLVTSVYAINTDGTSALVDGMLNSFATPYSNNIDKLDAIKFAKSTESFSTFRDTRDLTIERRQPLNIADTIYYRMTFLKLKSYTFEFEPTGFGNTNLAGFLEDNYLNTSTPVPLNQVTRTNFTVTMVDGAWAPGRFRMVFKPMAVLPVTLTSIKAWQQIDAVNVEWKAGNESDTRKYEIERSLNGILFATVATVSVTANNLGIYNWLDANAQGGINYYRIKTVSVNGESHYSSIVKVKMGKGKEQIVMGTNIISGDIITFQLVNMTAGIYGLKLFNNIGQSIYSNKISHTAGSSTENIELTKHPAKGIYMLEFIKPGNKKESRRLIMK